MEMVKPLCRSQRSGNRSKYIDSHNAHAGILGESSQANTPVDQAGTRYSALEASTLIHVQQDGLMKQCVEGFLLCNNIRWRVVISQAEFELVLE